MPGYNVQGRDPMNAQKYRTQRSESPEDLWQSLYDRVNIASGTVPSSIGFFATQRGQSATLITGTTSAAKTKTYRDTNMESSNVQPTKLHVFHGISQVIVYSNKSATTNLADKDLVLTGGYIEFKIVDKVILYAPLVLIPELCPTAVAATTANATTLIGNNYGGGPNVGMFKLPIPITLNPYENFTYNVVFDGTITISNTVDMQQFLIGFMRRPT